MNSKDNSLLEVARLGRLVGLKGELKLHLHSDFPEQFCKGKVFSTQKNLVLEIATYNQNKGLISFVGYQDRDKASALVNSFLFTTKEQSQNDCKLEEGEFFWFEVIGSTIQENEKILGSVVEIERIEPVDYLVVQTDESLVKDGMSKTFFIPFIERYVLRFDKEAKIVFVKDGLELLENS
ncbi:MAG TPA: 16S rRNA processing protein RimM [Sulfurospirillum sp. UBA11407]|jgi:16S rRNA processing protein RimM|nr:MAG TPA: 16S rRNA processing protein RimM [Sulfurospirillum sp. UBA11407]